MQAAFRGSVRISRRSCAGWALFLAMLLDLATPWAALALAQRDACPCCKTLASCRRRGRPAEGPKLEAVAMCGAGCAFPQRTAAQTRISIPPARGFSNVLAVFASPARVSAPHHFVAFDRWRFQRPPPCFCSELVTRVRSGEQGNEIYFS
jgi:hypothetical protein